MLSTYRRSYERTLLHCCVCCKINNLEELGTFVSFLIRPFYAEIIHFDGLEVVGGLMMNSVLMKCRASHSHTQSLSLPLSLLLALILPLTRIRCASRALLFNISLEIVCTACRRFNRIERRWYLFQQYSRTDGRDIVAGFLKISVDVGLAYVGMRNLLLVCFYFFFFFCFVYGREVRFCYTAFLPMLHVYYY